MCALICRNLPCSQKFLATRLNKIMQTHANISKLNITLQVIGPTFIFYKLAIEIDRNGHRDRYIGNEIKRQKAIEKELGCKLIRIDPDKEDFDIFVTINEIFRNIKLSSKKNSNK